jgi:Ca-activated chloride channel family protein
VAGRRLSIQFREVPKTSTSRPGVALRLMSFGAPQWMWGVLALPLMIALFVQAENKSAQRLRDFVSPRLLPQLTGRVNRFRRALRFGLLMLGLGLAIISLAQPRWGYVFEDARRKGIDLFIAVDTSRSMLSNDVQPNRLERVKLAAQDLINQLEGDRVGLIAFAGRAFVQAPLTIDYSAAIEAIDDLDTKTIPEGGTNISEAIALADKTYGKSAMGNRALVIFTDGEELSGDAVKTAKAAADAGARIFTVGVGTPEGSLIPIAGEDAGSAFVKDSKGQVVKSKLDEKRLREIAQATGGFYLHLESGPRTMQQLFAEGIAKMQAADIDVRLSRRPIERYEWPLGAALLALATSMLIGDRRRMRQTARIPNRLPATAVTAAALVFLSLQLSFATAPGLDAYRGGKFDDAYQEFQDTLKAHPSTSAVDKLQFDSGAAAYKKQDFGKALESFSQALLSPDTSLQSKSHYNLGNTLYERGEKQEAQDKKLTDWNNALQHYEQTLKIEPQNKEAKDNYDYVKKKIEELKNKRPQPSPSPSPSPKQDRKDQQKQSDQQKQQQDQKDQKQSSGQGQDQDQQQQQKQQQQQQSQSDSGAQENKNEKSEQNQSQAKNQSQNSKEQDQKSAAGETPSPTPGEHQQKPQSSPSPSSGVPRQDSPKSTGQEPSPTPGDGGNEMPSPSPSPGTGEGAGENGTPSPTPEGSPKKKLAGEVKGADSDKSDAQGEPAEMTEADAEKEGQMSERQAQALLQSMKDEEARVQLDERRATRHVYNDW